MTIRPDDVPAAMKAAFGVHRVAAAWNMLCSGDESNRMAALRGFERMLASRGLALEDVASAILALPDKGSARPGQPSASPFDDLFRGFMRPEGNAGFGKTPPPPPPPPPRPKVKPLKSREEIPASVFGTIRIDDERNIHSGPMITFTVETDEARYGPIVAFAGAHLERIKQAATTWSPIGLAIAQPKDARRQPSVVRIIR